MPDITAIVTAYRRPTAIAPLIEAIRSQTVPASQIWVWANEPTAAVAEAIAQVKVDHVVTSSVNAYFHARFALALTAPTEFVAVFDDDSVPGPLWSENCLATMEKTPGILGTAGVRLTGPCYATATKHGWHQPTQETVAVDLVGHAWFLRTQWLHYLFAEPAVLGTNGEDIELAARAMRFADVPSYCPPHPADDRSVWARRGVTNWVVTIRLRFVELATSRSVTTSFRPRSQPAGDRSSCEDGILLWF
ncbi:MAG: glycosyltransferase [Planctomycetes bacterium]|nr:glycosyltransferase [Planctomycetota bacterium]